jgi:hypothetical protein
MRTGIVQISFDGNSGDRESTEKCRDRQLPLEKSPKGETGNAKGRERVSSEAANLMQKSEEYYNVGDWNLISPMRVISYRKKRTTSGIRIIESHDICEVQKCLLSRTF